MAKKVRKALVLWHRIFGLTAGVWLFLVAATGSIVVFYEELDHALNPDLFNMAVTGEPLPVEELVAVAEAERPGSFAAFVNLPNEPTEPLIAYLASRPDAETPVPRGTHVFVDPYTGEALGDRVFGAFKVDRRHLAQFIYKFHRDLHLGRTGAFILGLAAFLWLFDHVVSVWISFPRLRHWWRSFTVRRSAKGVGKIWGLHRAAGLWLVPVTLVLALSGVYFNWYGSFVAVVDFFSPLTKAVHRTAPRLEEPSFAPAVSIDRAITVASQHAGDAEVDSVSILPFQGLYWARIFDSRDLADYGQRYVYVDMEDASIVADRHRTDGSAGDAFIAWQFPLHSGKAFGWPGRLAIFVAGLVTCWLVGTGFYLWARRLRERRRVSRRAKQKVEKPALRPWPAPQPVVAPVERSLRHQRE